MRCAHCFLERCVKRRDSDDGGVLVCKDVYVRNACLRTSNLNGQGRGARSPRSATAFSSSLLASLRQPSLVPQVCRPQPLDQRSEVERNHPDPHGQMSLGSQPQYLSSLLKFPPMFNTNIMNYSHRYSLQLN